MYPILQALLSDRKGGVVFTCFGLWHWCYLGLVFLAVGAIYFYLKGKGSAARERALNLSIRVAFGLYVLDFFLMSPAYGAIDVEKLPFHVCTAMCVMCFWSRHSDALRSWRLHFALLGFSSNLVYLIYPAGVMWHGVHPLSYRVVQTLLFHGAMTAYGFLALAFDDEGQRWDRRRDLAVIVGMILWAMAGNWLYGGYPRLLNWFFVVRDPFYLLPETVAPWVMPVVNVLVFLLAEEPVCRMRNKHREEFSS